MQPDDEDPEFYVNAICKLCRKRRLMAESIENTTVSEDTDFKYQEIALDSERRTKFRNLTVCQRFVLYPFVLRHLSHYDILSLSVTDYFLNGNDIIYCWMIRKCPN